MNLNEYFVTLRNRILRWGFGCAQYLYRHVFRSTPLIYRLPFLSSLMRFLSPPLSEKETLTAQRRLKENIVENQVSALKAQGITHIHFCVLHVELLGDIISTEPICHYLKTLEHNSTITWIVKEQFADIVKAFPLVDNIISVKTLADGFNYAMQMEKEASDIVIVNCHFDNTQDLATNFTVRNPCNPCVTLQTHYSFGNLLQSFCLAAGIPRLDATPQLAIDERERAPGLPTDYVVFHCHSSNAFRNWPNDKWDALASWLCGLGIAVVEIGVNKAVAINHSNHYDRTGRRNLLELAAIVKAARIFVGVDSGFSHVANAFHVPSIILLGRFAYFDTYFPYSGGFAHSDSFRCVRAPLGQYVRAIAVDEVQEAFKGFFAKHLV